jgi:hypothetical protein
MWGKYRADVNLKVRCTIHGDFLSVTNFIIASTNFRPQSAGNDDGKHSASLIYAVAAN